MTKSQNYIITAANDPYFKNLKQLIYSYYRAREYHNSSLIIYDIGLNSQQAEEIKSIQSGHYRLFNFNDYPEFVKPRYNTYSWKPIIIHQATLEHQGNFLWMDSANCILRNLSPIWKEIEEKYTYAPISGSGTLREWTVRATLNYLKVPEHYHNKRNRAGNTFGFSMQSEVMKKLIYNWKKLALIRECIRPEGANRSNHRDDQSLLTILLLNEEENGTLELTEEEVNISSGKPSRYISVRNSFPKRINLSNGAFAHLYFLIQRQIDIMVNKIRGN